MHHSHVRAVRATRPTVIATSALGLTLSLAACGKGGPQTTVDAAGTPLTSQNFVEAMNTTSASNTTAHLESTITTRFDDGGATDAPSPAPVPSVPAGTAVKIGMSGDLRLNQKKPEFQIAMTMPSSSLPGAETTGDVSFEMRLVDSKMYLKVPDAVTKGLPNQMVPAGKFMVIDLAGNSEVARKFQASLGQSDPGMAYGVFTQGVKDVKHVGTEDVDGVATNKYVVTVDLASVLKASGQDAKGSSLQTMPKEVPVNVWVDKDKRVRRETLELGAGGMSVSMDMKFSKYGEPVSITAPPAGDTVPAPPELVDGISASA